MDATIDRLASGKFWNPCGTTSPKPDGNFWGHSERTYWRLVNETDAPSQIDGVTITFGADRRYPLNVELAPGEELVRNFGGGGTSHKDSILWEEIKPDTTVFATVELDGAVHTVPLQEVLCKEP